jgi:hypothetical protein
VPSLALVSERQFASAAGISAETPHVSRHVKTTRYAKASIAGRPEKKGSDGGG